MTGEDAHVYHNISQTKELSHCHEYTSDVEVYFYVNVVVLLLVITLGLVGNSLVVAVHCIDPAKNSSSVLLLALAVFDNILLLNGMFGSVFHSAFPYTGSGHWFWDFKDHFFVICHPIYHWAQTCSTWCIVLVTIDRYIAVSRPLKVTSLCTVKRARASILMLSCLATVYNVPRAFEYSIRESKELCSNATLWRKEKTTYTDNDYYQYGYNIALYYLINYVLPLLLLLLLNGLLLKRVNGAATQLDSTRKPELRRHSSSGRLLAAEESINKMVICIIIRFIVCATPGLALHVLIVLKNPVKDTYEIFSNLLIYLNSSTNFIIFAATGKRFRRIMMTSLCKSKRRQRKDRRQLSLASLQLFRSISASAIPTSRRLSKNDSLSISNCSMQDKNSNGMISKRKLTRCISWASGGSFPTCNAKVDKNGDIACICENSSNSRADGCFP